MVNTSDYSLRAMVNTSDSIRLIEDSVIHLSVLLVLIELLKKTMKLYYILKIKVELKTTKHFIPELIDIY